MLPIEGTDVLAEDIDGLVDAVNPAELFLYLPAMLIGSMSWTLFFLLFRAITVTKSMIRASADSPIAINFDTSKWLFLFFVGFAVCFVG